MKIFIASPTQNRLAKRGTRLPNLADILCNLGYSVEYVTGDFDHAKKCNFKKNSIKKQQSKEKFRLTLIRVSGYKRNISVRRVFSNFLMTTRYFFYLKKTMSDNDTLLVPPRPVEMILMARILKLSKRIKVIVDITDVWPDAFVFPNNITKMIFTLYCNFMLYPSIKHMDLFINNAPSFIHWLNRYAPKANSTFIPSGFDKNRWGNNCKIKKDTCWEKRLVCVAALQYQIDIMPFLEALIDRKDISLTIIGEDGKGERYREVIEFIGKNSMKNVYFTGVLSYREVVEHLKKQSIGVIPMISNALPNKVFDYIGACLPIITLGQKFDAGKFVEKHSIGWALPFDSNHIGRLLDDMSTELCYNKIKNILKIRDNYSQQELFLKYANIITS